MSDHYDRYNGMEELLDTNLAEVGTDVPDINVGDMISRQAAIDAAMQDVSCIRTHEFNAGATRAANRIKRLPSEEPQIIRCKDCKYWNSGSCEYPEHAVNCQDYWVGDIETEAEHFCGYAERREVTT